ncbi:P-loop containing nucleoside triphosphate hydrolase protein [Spinellus fusiger]|nr:P-loop containing nucleoside triphosphate hydrolase protein [Spinellus fusiger]
MSNNSHCFCSMPAFIVEAKRRGANQGRWFWRCATSRCNFFKWDASSHAFTIHPAEAYAASFSSSTNPSLPPHLLKRHNKEQPILGDPTNSTIVQFSLISNDLISIKATHNETLIPVLKSIPDIAWDSVNEQWTLPANITSYKCAISRMPTHTPNLYLKLQPLLPSLQALLNNDNNSTPAHTIEFEEENDRRLRDVSSTPLWNHLREYQKQGIKTGIEKKGRVFLGYERGLGKTPEGLGIALAYKDSWPVLIICPAHLCITWKEEIKQWLNLDDKEIHVTLRSSDVLNKKYTPRRTPPESEKLFLPKKRKSAHSATDSSDHQDTAVTDSDSDAGSELYTDPDPEKKTSVVQFYIIDYDLATRHSSRLKEMNFKIIMCDECHQMKNRLSKRVKVLLPIFFSSSQLIMMTSLSEKFRPVDLHTQLYALRQDIFPDFTKFSTRYCSPVHSVFGWDYSEKEKKKERKERRERYLLCVCVCLGTSNLKELEHLMTSSVWIHHSRKHIAYELPERIKQAVFVNIPVKHKQQLKRLNKATKDTNTTTQEDTPVVEEETMDNEMLECGRGKVNAIIDCIDNMVWDVPKPKIIVFGYHKDLRDTIETRLIQKSILYARIDSSTEIEDRQKIYNDLKSSQVKHIVLWDINAIDTSLKFHGADLVIFSELSGNIQQLLDAEKFAHRSENNRSLQVKYFVAIDTLDGDLWSLIKDDILCDNEDLSYLEELDSMSRSKDSAYIEAGTSTERVESVLMPVCAIQSTKRTPQVICALSYDK